MIVLAVVTVVTVGTMSIVMPFADLDLDLVNDSGQDENGATDRSFAEETVRDDVNGESGVGVPSRLRNEGREDVVRHVELAVVAFVLQARHHAFDVELLTALVRGESGLVVHVVAVESEVGNDVVGENLEQRAR